MSKEFIMIFQYLLKDIKYTYNTFRYTCKDCIGSQYCKDKKICRDFKRL